MNELISSFNFEINSNNTSSHGMIEKKDIPIEKVTIVRKNRLMKKDIQKLMTHHLFAEFEAIRAELYCPII